MRASAALVLVVLVLFSLPTLFIDFFHVEDDCCGSERCPACQFRLSTTAIAAAVVVDLPQPELQATVRVTSTQGPEHLLQVARSSRSPPQT